MLTWSPVTINILLKISHSPNQSCSKWDSFWASFLVLFFILFQKPHLLPASEMVFNPWQKFTRDHFQHDFFSFLLSLQWFKIIQLGQMFISVPLVSILSSPICPVLVVRNAFFLTSAVTLFSQTFCFQITGLCITMFA